MSVFRVDWFVVVAWDTLLTKQWVIHHTFIEPTTGSMTIIINVVLIHLHDKTSNAAIIESVGNSMSLRTPFVQQIEDIANEVCLSTKDATSIVGCNSGFHAGKRSEGKVSLPLCSLTIWYYRYALSLRIAKPDPASAWHSELNTSLGTTTRNHNQINSVPLNCERSC